MEENDTRKYSLEELRELRERGETETRADAPVFSLEPDFWENARVVMPPPGKSSIHLRVDTDVLDWFKAQGRGHLTRMNAVLRSFMEAQEATPPPVIRPALFAVPARCPSTGFEVAGACSRGHGGCERWCSGALQEGRAGALESRLSCRCLVHAL